jgi:pimeloyl-ACP methyl ester carboxylesterase
MTTTGLSYKDAHRLTPGSQLVVLDCGHDVSVDLPEEFNRLALEFLSGA